MPGFQDSATKITFYFGENYKLTKLEVYTTGCGPDQPVVYKKSLSLFNETGAFADPTAMAYFVKLKDMERDLTARTPMPWIEFLLKYTYPAIYVQDGLLAAQSTESTAGSCVKKVLAKEAKQFGQDLLDETFGLADAIAYKFHKNLCYKDEKKVLEEHQNFGFWTVTDPTKQDFKQNLLALAQERAYGEMDTTSAGLCAVIGGMGDKEAAPGSSQKTLDDMWQEVVEKIKICGLNDLMLSAIQCILKGMSLEEGLSKMLKAALKGMGVEDFGALFVLLPAEKQAELDALVQHKLESGDIFKDSKFAQQLSDGTTGNLGWNPRDPNTNDTRPWNDEQFVKNKANPGSTSSTSSPQATRRTLVQTLDFSSADKRNTLNPNIVLEAYVLALLEIYNGYYLELLDAMNQLPGSEIIGAMITAVDCPGPPPGATPTGYDRIKNNLEVPYCFNIHDIRLPRVENPFIWLPGTKDILGLLIYAAKQAIQEAVLRAITQLFLKICQTVSASACIALELAGDLAQSPFSEDTLKDIVKETFCGPDGTSDEAEAALVELIAALGPGAIALADQQQALRFAADLSSATTRREFTNGFLGKSSPALIKIALNLVKTDYIEYKDALGNEAALEAFFKNMGAAMPVAMQAQMRDYLEGLGEDGDFPANPSLCATPDQLEEWCDIRGALLADRATPEQKAYLCASPEIDLAEVMQSGPGQYLAASLPPIMSEPGCDNGLLPFEPAEAVEVATSVLDNNLEKLKMSFLTDMLGNGPFESDWGMLNLILSDTRGNPLSTHNRKKEWDLGWQQDYVDFYVESAGNFWDPYESLDKQKGAWPVKVAEWLRVQFEDLDTQTTSNNDFQATQIESTVTFKQKGFDGWFGNVNLLSLPDLGYNIETEVDFEAEDINFIALGRKATPDTILEYRDNNDSQEEGGDPDNWAYGFDLEIFLNDMEHTITPSSLAEEGLNATPTIHNRPDDNVRVKIYELSKALDLKALSNAKISGVALTDLLPIGEPTRELKYEFLSVDDTLNNIDLDDYVKFLATFDQQSDHAPPLVLLQEMIEQNGASAAIQSLKSFYDSTTSAIFESLAAEIASNEDAFMYGAALDNLTDDDLTYVIDSGQVEGVPGGTPYRDVEIADPETGLLRKLKNSDQILGISEYQWNVKSGLEGYTKNRVYYLNPDKFGGSYKSPPIYMVPPQDKGWFGLIDVLFPEQGACKPSRSDLVDFGDIQEQIEKSYRYIPEDERLKIDRDCALELPYNRILERSAVAGLESIITAAIRIYASVHFVKSLATFTTVKPDFFANFSSVYASYVIEDMEEAFKDAQAGAAEFFTLFKDEEFWYAFLEQAVQLYSRRVDGKQLSGESEHGYGEILDPPPNVLNALYRINDMQEEYVYAYREDLKAAKKNNDAGQFQTLRGYREDKSLEAVQATEEDAKLVLKELVKEQLQIMGEKFINNLDIIDLSPSIHNIAYYLLEELSEGSTLSIDGKQIKEKIDSSSNLPTAGEEHYTNGNELVTENGDNYVGLYHVHSDSYMEGEFHVDESHGLLTPLSNQIIIVSDNTPIGDVANYGTTTSTTKPFTIEKYIAIEGIKYPPSDAATIIAQNDPATNISELYPGTLAQVTDKAGRVVGLEGELGVRYGVEFSINIGGIKTPLTTAEIDVLDLPVQEFKTISADSKILLCLINKLKDDEKFKLIYKYIFPLPKMTSILAIYNDMGFLPSIGEITVPVAETAVAENLPGNSIGGNEETPVLVPGATGWLPPSRRDGNWLRLGWDQWDQVLMRNSKSRIKKLFKVYYNSAGGMQEMLSSLKNSDRASWTWVKNMRSRLKPRTGADLLPWWKKRKLRSNPFDSNGNLCEKK
jgi:hypothetical protein